jgi:signal transduction histidine kinase
MRVVSSLTNRIFVALTVLATLSLGFASFFANARASAAAEAELARGLEEAAAIVDQHRLTLTDTLTRMARLVADLPVLKAAVDTGDPPTVQPLAERYLTQVNADLFIVHDARGRVLAAAGGYLDDVLQATSRAETADGVEASIEETSTFVPHEHGVLQVVSVPISLGFEPTGVLGRLTVGFVMDDALAAQFRALTGSEIAFASGGKVLASSLAPALRPALAGIVSAPANARVSLGGDEYLALARPMLREPGRDTPVTVTLRSRSERLRFLNTVRAGLVGALIVTVLLATGLSYGVARTMTRPLAAVTTAMRDVAATGDLSRKVVVRSRAWDDEDARLLAGAFNTLTESIARFQRESAQKDRLSSLGRLSTVIAHEIRNPLMIIRAALPSLRRASADERDRADAGPADTELTDALADIDEESMRINRIVTEVLDFAKPITFELADASVNEICRASAAAAWADHAGTDARDVRLDLDASEPHVVTDSERLRTALVNLLTNARQATEAVSDRPRAPVTLSTQANNGRVTIVVRDHGVGIAPENMTHIFDPYFTTRRAGTGIGLPITKNIVEGMGGTIAVASQPGRGTEFTVDLPRVAEAA